MKLLLYCTKSKPYLMNLNTKYFISSDRESLRYIDKQDMKSIALNGKIVGECEFEIEEIECRISVGMNGIHDEYTTKSLGENELLYASKIDEITFINYLKGKNGYAIHIKNLNIFDKPRELEDYRKVKITRKKFSEIIPNTKYESLTIHRLIQIVAVENAPQNMMYVYGGTISLKETKAIKVERYILISIRPEWLCKILNGEKTIEVRRKVLKEMITDA